MNVAHRFGDGAPSGSVPASKLWWLVPDPALQAADSTTTAA
jgi:hypothetical protein